MDQLNDTKGRVDAAVMAENKKLKEQLKIAQRDIWHVLILCGLLFVFGFYHAFTSARWEHDQDLQALDEHVRLLSDIKELHHQLDAANGAIAGYKTVIEMYANAAERVNTPQVAATFDSGGVLSLEPSNLYFPVQKTLDMGASLGDFDITEESIW